MVKYRRKAEVIEAAQLTDTAFDGDHPNPEHVVGVTYCPESRCALVPLKTGFMRANVGDWIIRDADGGMRTCSPEDFAKAYGHAEVKPSLPSLETAFRAGAVAMRQQIAAWLKQYDLQYQEIEQMDLPKLSSLELFQMETDEKIFEQLKAAVGAQESKGGEAKRS